MHEARRGNPAQARQGCQCSPCAGLGSRQCFSFGGGLALARAGDAARSQTIADKLNSDFPLKHNRRQNQLPDHPAVIDLNRVGRCESH